MTAELLVGVGAAWLVVSVAVSLAVARALHILDHAPEPT
jgi:hypothetical protein